MAPWITLVCRCLLPVALMGLVAGEARSAVCDVEDLEVFVAGKDECLVMRRYGSMEPSTLLVWLHGDVSSGGPASYHFRDAQQAADRLAGSAVLSVALVRPGYPDGASRSSSVAFGHSGRRDHYSKVNITELASAIGRLQARFHPQATIVIGHSGGAAMAASKLGLFPSLVQGAVLVSCPCDLKSWREGRQPWSLSEDPMTWAPQVGAKVEVVALTGDRDGTTLPALAQRYVGVLAGRGVPARFEVLPQTEHNGALASPEVVAAVEQMLAKWAKSAAPQPPR